MELRFDGKTILVTGASGGIGSAVAKAFARAGATVAMHYFLNSDRAERVIKGLVADQLEVFGLKADLTDSREAEFLVDSVLSRTGRLDVLVNCAGALIQRTAFVDIDDALYQRLLDVNVRTTVTTCRAVIPPMRAADGGSIVNVSSVASRTGGRGNAVYAAAKGAVSALSRGLASELAADRIRVNIVEPGLIDTDLHRNVTSPDQFERIVARIPIGRAGVADDCVGAVLFLAHPGAASYITGQTIGVNGGLFMA